MAVSNEIFILVTGIMFTYLVIYKKNRLIGNIAYIALGGLTLSYGTGNLTAGTGLIILIGSIINTLYDLIIKPQT